MPARLPQHDTEDAAIAEVRAIYRELEARPVERACIRRTECCQFQLTGVTPLLTRGETLLMLKGLRAAGRTRVPEKTDGTCPMLGPGGKCIIYESRPFGCRTHFCRAAGGPYSRKEVLDLIRRLEKVDSDLGGGGPRSIQASIARETA